MPKVTFLPQGVAVDVEKGTGVVDAAHLVGISLDLPCGGKGTCGKCLVKVSEGALDTKPGQEHKIDEAGEGFVHACLSSIKEDVVITVPEQSSRAKGAHLDDSIDLTGPGAHAIPELSPLSSIICLDVPPAASEDGLSDLDRLGRAISKELEGRKAHVPLPVIRKLARTLREQGGKVVLALAEGSDGMVHVVDIKAGSTGAKNFGIAVDLGTTTVSVQLLDLSIGKVLSTRNGYNDQISCGLDVISRINYASAQERLSDLRNRAVLSINRLIREAASDAQVSCGDIYSCAISGNTVMTHLLLGLDPDHIRLEPYTPTVLGALTLPAGELGICVNENALVRLSPSVGSYVGGDITAGILATDLFCAGEDVSLFIDIGTNGEIVLGNTHFLMTCACSAGPAFEGGGIDCGMRATTGAIDHVEIDHETGAARYTVIGGGKPTGICGSGLIDLLSGLFLAGFLDPSGRLDRTGRCPSVSVRGRRASYTVAQSGETAQGKAVVVTEIDISNLMRAKAAIYSASALMLAQTGLAFGDIGKFYVAGGFGRFLNLESAVAIGLLPDIQRDKFTYIGNASLTGTRSVLLSKELRSRQEKFASGMTYVDLSTFPGYMDAYTAALFLPHTEGVQFPSVMGKL